MEVVLRRRGRYRHDRPARRRAVPGVRFRVRQRVPRHRQRRRHGDLHPHAAPDAGRGLVGRSGTSSACYLGGRGRLRHRQPAAGRPAARRGSGPGFAMVLALLLSAIIWNLGTWYLGLPASSSHTLIGSILGVGLANSADGSGRQQFGDGVNWAQGAEVGTGAADLADGRLRLPRPAAAARQGRHPRAARCTSRPTARRRRPAGSAALLVRPAPASASPTAPTTARRAWA